MVNQVKKGGDGLRLQVTKPARKAGLVEENTDGEPIRLASVYVYGFDDLLLVVNQTVDMGHRADLISTVAQSTESMHGGYPATIAEAGNGYQVNLPGAGDAGFRVGDKAPVVPTDGMLLIHNGTQRELIERILTLREEQVSS